MPRFLTRVGSWFAAAVASPASPADQPSLYDSQDGWLDIGGFLDTAYGFVPLVMPITEPAVGYGAVGALVFVDRNAPVKMATADNAELLALSGQRSPYVGKLGVVEEGALADLLLVDGDPIANINLIADPARNFLLIMKDGKIYKDSLGAIP